MVLNSSIVFESHPYVMLGFICSFPMMEKKIAHNLFNGLCIQCGTKKYYFAEFEFYYYDKEGFNAEWNKKTYPRTGKKAGDLFFHYSGFDICFDSDYDKGVFGGILIRSLFDEDKQKYITGQRKVMQKRSTTLLNSGNPNQVPIDQRRVQ